MPPHRHQYYIENEEVPYDEAYFFRFSKPQGFALGWLFDDGQKMDTAVSIRNNDTIYMDQGYHPVACAPGANLYQLTVMSGPYRISRAKLHDDFRSLLEESNLENPYQKQNTKK
jgi:5-deoxy-glucuronate isomerase